jgi:hypothetical protein
MSPSLRNSHAKVCLDQLIQATGRSLDQHRDAYWRLVNVVRASSTLLAQADGPSRYHRLESERIVAACSFIAEQSERWTREPETWLPSGHSQWQLFRSLLDHLFAQFPLPGFMTRVWLAERHESWEMELYFHLARGRGVRQFGMSPYPWRLTKSGARFFMQVPDDLQPAMAFRWAQIQSLGGDIRLARSLLRTVLAAPTADEAFWETVIRFLIENWPLPGGEAESIVHFIQQQRFEPAERVWGRGAGTQPLQPDFGLAGWSLSAMRRHMANWQAELASRITARFCVEQRPGWEPTTIQPLEFNDGAATWSICELLTASELRVEGGIMRHCVGSYVSACRSRRTSIWSMRVDRGQTQRRELTIEVVPETKTIRQANGKFNAPPSSVASRLLLLWAKQAGLKFDSSVSVGSDR